MRIFDQRNSKGSSATASPSASPGPAPSASSSPHPWRLPVFFSSLAPRTRSLLVALPIGALVLTAILTPSILLTRDKHVTRFADPVIGRGSGSFHIAISHLGVVNPDIVDPYFPNSTDRKTMTTVFYPIFPGHCSKDCRIPYMPPATAAYSNAQFFGEAEANVFEQVSYNACCECSVSLDPGKENVIIIEPAAGTSRLLYGGIANEIATHGFVVFLLDHFGDAGIVEWVDPSDPRRNITFEGKLPLDPFQPMTQWNKTIDDAIAVRAADVSFLLDQLSSKPFVDQLLPNFTTMSTFNPATPTAIIGHGLGGTVATWASANVSSQFPLSINMAGTPPLLTSDLNAGQVVFLGRTGARREDDIHWPTTWKHLWRGTEWTMQNAGIFDYSDLPYIESLAGGGRKAKGRGEIEGWKAFGIAAQWARAYVAMQFHGEEKGGDLKGLFDFFGEAMVPYRPA